MDLRPKILMYEAMHSKGTEILEKKCDLVYADSLKEGRLTHLASEVEAIIIRANGAVTEKIMEAAAKLKVIGRHGVGLDAIDLAAAKKQGVKVVYTPQANKESVAEHFVALALMLAKKIRLADVALRDGNWQARYELIGTELRGKTLGVLGFGRIGQQTARICRFGFDMHVLYYDPIEFSEAEKELDALRIVAAGIGGIEAGSGRIVRITVARQRTVAVDVNHQRLGVTGVGRGSAAGAVCGTGTGMYCGTYTG